MTPREPRTTAQRRRRIPHLLAVLSLAPGALQAFGIPDVPLGVLTTLVVVANVVALRSSDPPRSVLIGIHLLNAALCGYLAWSLAQQGKQGLPYAWGLAAVLFLGVTLVQLVAPPARSTGRRGR